MKSPLRICGQASSVEETAMLAGMDELILMLNTDVTLSPSLDTFGFLQLEGIRLEGTWGLPTTHGAAACGGVEPQRLFWS